jgi:UDP-N-acetylmuramate--alanine ligase
MLGRTRHIHFVGIGGSGMSGIAELVANLGYEVSGSDASLSPVTARLAGLGVRISGRHEAANVGQADVVVVSSAIRSDNPEVVEAVRRQVPVIPRAEMLAELMRLRYGIAVAGAHGKTTTTSMIAVALEQADLDPTAVIGGRLQAFGGSARLGRGDYLVAEADESDGSFLKLTPTIAVLTNVDREHLDTYVTYEQLQQAFVAFANKVPFYGAVVACGDDPVLMALRPRMNRRVVTYGFGPDAGDVQGFDPTLEPFRAQCGVRYRTGSEGRWASGSLRLKVPGRHNLLNALAAVAVGLEIGVAFERLAEALAGFGGVERRFQLVGEAAGVMVVDDYGHHPTEIAAVIAAARAGFGRRLLLVFQPHRYTRTHLLADELGEALAAADEIVLTEVYGAGETPIPGATAETVAAAVRRSTDRPVHVVAALDEVVPFVARLARPGDLVVTLGAGSIGTIPGRLLSELTLKAKESARHPSG